MYPYWDALNAMHGLLGALGEQRWRSWIAEDIREGETRKSVQHHLSAYGGVGSFNAIMFPEDVWLGTLFDDLRGACFHLTPHPLGRCSLTACVPSMGNIIVMLSCLRFV